MTKSKRVPGKQLSIERASPARTPLEATPTPDLLEYLEEYVQMFQRYYAAYISMVRVIRSETYDEAEVVGAPLLEFRASANGVQVINVIQDLGDVPVEDRVQVCRVFAASQRSKLVQTAVGMLEAVTTLKESLLQELAQHEDMVPAVQEEEQETKENDGRRAK